MRTRRVSLGLVGALVAPAVLVAFVFGMVVATGLNCGSGPVQAQSVPVVGAGLPAGEDESPFERVAELVVPMVVNISAEKTVTRSSVPSEQFEGPFGEFFRHFFGEAPEFPQEQQRAGVGSGVVIDPKGYVVTNNHVVSNFDKLTVTLSDGTEFRGEDVEVVGTDPKTDLAVIKVKSDRELPAIRMAGDGDIRVGSWAIAIGNAFGLQSTVTVGVVSATGRSGIPLPEGPSYQDFIQTDASINPGNSGGALVNIRGELIGINSAIRSPVGANVGVGFAVPVGMVKSVTSQLIEKGRVVRGFLGVRPQPVTEAIRKAMDLASTEGVLVSEVVSGMPAEKAGLKAGDVIVKVDDTGIRDIEQFRRQVADYAPGTTVTLGVVRDGKRLTKKVKLVEFPEDEQLSETAPEPAQDWLGLRVRNLTEDEKAEAVTRTGVMVTAVEAGSAAGDAGLRQGDILLEVGGTAVPGVAEYNRTAERLSKSSEPVLMRVLRGGNRFFVAVEP